MASKKPVDARVRAFVAEVLSERPQPQVERIDERLAWLAWRWGAASGLLC